MILKEEVENKKDFLNSDIFSESEPYIFIEQLKKIKDNKKAFIDWYTEDEYKEKGIKLFLSENKKYGFGVSKNRELVSVFSLENGSGDLIVKEAIKCGVDKLWCLGEKLKSLYGRNKFKVIEEYNWDENLAPKNWDYEKYGRPNCYYMELS